MYKFYPKMYKKNIADINYDKLKKTNIKLIIFDLDNTITEFDNPEVDERIIKILKKIKKDFIIYILSNNTNKKRVKNIAEQIDCQYHHFANKPLKFKYNKIKKKHCLKNEEIAIVGDQLLTDVYLANRSNSYSILVDPIKNKDLKITSFNRKIENKIIKKYQKKDLFKKGDYYD